MGKVKDETPATRAASKSAPKGQNKGATRSRIAPFLINLFRGTLYKPAQGWNARLWTGLGLGLLVLVGVWRLYESLKDGVHNTVLRYSIPVLVGVVFGWLVVRILHYPPFADFLIATEAEMNKVSWTHKDDLIRATVVVLVTVLFLTAYLFGVDWVWSSLLQLIGVLKFEGSGIETAG